jgi:DivIVA domain-containing protein
MSSSRLPLSSRPAFLPDEIARREFATVFRGYDPSEVRTFLNQMSEQVVETADRVAELQKVLTETQERVKNPELTEEMVTSLLGEQTAQILRSAREAAREQREKADEESGQQLRDAHEVATRMREEAEALLADRTTEAEQTADAIRSEAARDAEGVRRAANEEATALRNQVADEVARTRAELEAEAIRQREQLEKDINLEMSIARQQAREIIDTARDEAQALVARTQERQTELIEGLVRKRKIALAQIEGLRSGRARLLEAYKLVRETLDDVTQELGRSDGESRERADDARTRAATAAELTEQDLDEVVEVVELTLDDDVSQAAIKMAAEPDQPENPEPAPTVILPEQFVGEKGEPGPYDFASGEWSSEGEPTQLVDVVDLTDANQQATQQTDQQGTAPSAPAASSMQSAPTGTLQREVAEIQVDTVIVEPESDEALDAEAEEVYQAGSLVIGENNSDNGLKLRRDAVVGKARSQALRRLKRALQDEEENLLARLRTGDGKSVQALLGSPEDQSSAYNRAIVKLLREVVRTGASSVQGSIGVERGVIDHTGTAAARELASEVVDQLRTVLVPVVEQMLDQPELPSVEELGSTIGTQYDVVKGDRLERLIDARIGAAFDEGVSLATAGSGRR